jgi:hypothetical protein
VTALESALPTPIWVLHAGALEVPGREPIYADLVRQGVCKAVAVDPCEDEDRRTASVAAGRFTRYHDATLGDGAEHTFHLCRMRSRSSLYEPNEMVASLFDGFHEGSEVDDRRRVRTTRLDDLVDEEFDLIVLDLQGGELAAIEGGSATLGGALVVHTEVELVGQYVGQPLWGDVDRSLRRLGFQMHTVHSYGSRPYRPFEAGDRRLDGLRQWLWAEVVYIRNPLQLSDLPRDRLVKLGVLLHALYGSYDLAHYAFAAADPEFASEYAAGLGAVAESL